MSTAYRGFSCLSRYLIVSILVILIPVIVYGSSAGPPNMKTGAPGEGTCHDCHNTYVLNSGPGTFSMDTPASFQPGETYQITVTVTQSDRQRWGFEFTPLDIGTITITDPTNTQQATEESKIYVKQTSTGTYSGNPGPAVWNFNWTAPASPPDTVRFYAAGNAADGNFSRTNDYIYTTTSFSVLFSDTESPNPITDLSIDEISGNIVLEWTDPGDNIGVVEYRVYRSEEGYFDPESPFLATVTGLTWTDMGAAGDPDMNHFYIVTAVDDADNEGDSSNIVGEVDFELPQ